MKRMITTIYAFVFITILTSCAQNGEPINPKSDTKKAVTLSIIDINGEISERTSYPLNTKTIPYRISNNTDETCKIVIIPKLEKNLGWQYEDKWEQIPLKDDVGFCGTPDTIDSGEIYNGEVDLLNFTDLPQGLYQLSFENHDKTSIISAVFVLQD